MEIQNIATALIDEERAKQMRMGYTPAHDDNHERDEMIRAAFAFALMDPTAMLHRQVQEGLWRFDTVWPWEDPKPKRFTLEDVLKENAAQIEDTVKAAAMLVAEIERLQRERARMIERKEQA